MVQGLDSRHFNIQTLGQQKSKQSTEEKYSMVPWKPRVGVFQSEVISSVMLLKG